MNAHKEEVEDPKPVSTLNEGEVVLIVPAISSSTTGESISTVTPKSEGDVMPGSMKLANIDILSHSRSTRNRVMTEKAKNSSLSKKLFSFYAFCVVGM